MEPYTIGMLADLQSLMLILTGKMYMSVPIARIAVHFAQHGLSILTTCEWLQ